MTGRSWIVQRLACALAAAPLWAFAQGFLPPIEQVDRALQSQPDVRAAAARVDAAAATGRALQAGSYEYEASAVAQRRKITDEHRRYSEWEAQISRTIRLPAKARLDRQIGDSTREVALLRLAGAEHQGARRLLDAWMGWIRSAVTAQETTDQEALLSREKQALARRVALGDAAQRELDLMEAERALLAAQAITARDAALAARQALASEFPHIVIPSRPPALPQPQPLEGPPQQWRERIVRDSADAGMADAEAMRLARLAQRVQADRTPDPTVGVRVLSDRGGAERTVGLMLTVPFGNDYRSALAATESANAVAAEADAASVRRSVEQAAWMAVQAVGSRHAQWQSYEQALAAQLAASTRTRRAWELGEAALGEHLLAQRNLRQARLAQVQAQVDALQAALLVRIDAHELWHFAAPVDGDAR